MPRVENGLAAPESAPMFADDLPVLANDDAIGIGLDFDRATDGAGLNRVQPPATANSRRPRGRQSIDEA
jgi:hypothetical protein